jgi:hypothetical protein
MGRVAGHYTGAGGEFTVSGTGLDTSRYSPSARDIGRAGSFQSFCLERQETVSGTNLHVVNSAASFGGTASSIDPISVGTAWLYCEFATGGLADYGYDYARGSGRSASAGLLQAAIWVLEDEFAQAGQATPDVSANPFYLLALDAFGSEAAAKADNVAGGYGVYVLNMYDVRGDNDIRRRQDQLYYDGVDRVPEGGASLAFLAIGLACTGTVRRFVQNPVQ